MYQIDLSNGEIHHFNTVHEIKMWMVTNRYLAENNAALYGIHAVILQSGRCCIYAEDNNSVDFIDGSIILEDD